MRVANPTVGIMAVCAILLIAGPAVAQDWPQWRGPDRDGTVTGFEAPETWPEQLTEKWKVTVGAGDATPAVVGDRLYVFAREGNEEIVRCLDAANGEELWQDKYSAPRVSGPASGHAGPRSSPAVADGKVVTLGVAGVLSCYDAAEGELVWRKDDFSGQWPQFYVGLSPIIVDRLVVAHLGGGNTSAIIAYDLADGEEKWRFRGGAPTYCSPVLMTVGEKKLVVCVTAGGLVGVDTSDGTPAWQLPPSSQRMGDNAPTPIIDGQKVIYTGRQQGTRAVKVEQGDDGLTATEVWNNPQVGSHFSTPVLRDGMLYGISDRGNLFCLNAETGETAWTDTARRDNYGGIVDAGSVLMALPISGELVVFEPNAEAYAEVAAIKVAGTQTYAYPVLVGNRLVVKDQDSVTLWVIE